MGVHILMFQLGKKNEYYMEIRRTIKIFLASSEELKEEREKFGNLIRRLDDRYLKRGIHIKLLVWEDLDPCYNNVRKQDEYNAWIRESHIFVCLFYTKAGEYTLEELNVAKAENARRKEPKVIIYCRDLQDGDVDMPELAEFKQSLARELNHFWGHFSTTDKLHLDFVMFLLNREGDVDGVKVEKGNVVFDGMHVANLDNLPFASENEDYKDMKQRLETLSVEVNQLWDAIQQAPSVEMLRSLHQQKLNEYNTLKERFGKHQQALFDTAKRISEIQLEKVDRELQRAIIEFENGHIEAANAILDGIESETDCHERQMELDHSLIHRDIEALQMKTKILMDNLSIPIEERIKLTLETYQKADRLAMKSAMAKDKYVKLLFEYGEFLYTYAKYDQALSVWLRNCKMNEELYGSEHPITATSYNNIGNVYYFYGEYEKARDYYEKALKIRVGLLGPNHPETAKSYNNMGDVFYILGDYVKAMDYYQKDLSLCERILGNNHLDTAKSYNNIGLVYCELSDSNKALECYQKALEIRKKVLGPNHPDVACLYNNIGIVYDNLCDYRMALTYYLQAMEIQEKVLGLNHPDTASSYNNIGSVYISQKRYADALNFFQKSMDIKLKTLSAQNTDIANTYYNMGITLEKLKKYEDALGCYYKALDIWNTILGSDNANTIQVKRSLESLKRKMRKSPLFD